jgi:hypothetical protein
MSNDLIGRIPKTIEKALAELLRPDETVKIQLKGAFKEVLVCTNRRVIVLKSGLMTGQWFGMNQFQLPLEMVSSAEVNATLGIGYFEVSAGGVQNKSKSYWSGGENSAQKAPNCVSLSGMDSVKTFRSAATRILEMASAARVGSALETKNQKQDVSEALGRLWQMKNEGALTDEQFEAAKVKLLSE